MFEDVPERTQSELHMTSFMWRDVRQNGGAYYFTVILSFFTNRFGRSVIGLTAILLIFLWRKACRPHTQGMTTLLVLYAAVI